MQLHRGWSGAERRGRVIGDRHPQGGCRNGLGKDSEEVEEGSRSERHVEVAGGRWVRESQPVSGVANSRAWDRGTDAVNQVGGVSRRSWFLMR